MSGKHITVLGGSGFVGRSLVAHLANLGHKVKVLTRYRDNCKSFAVIPQVQIVQGNVHHRSFLSREIAGSDVVVNLVSILNEFRSPNEKFQRVHVELTQSVAECCAEHDIDKLVYISALKADAEDGPSNYLRTKGEAENIIKRVATGAFQWSILQPSVIFGPDDSFVNRFAGLLKLPSPVMPLPRATARFAPVYVEDVVKAIACCVDDPATNGKTYQLCGPHVYSLKEIVEKIRAQLGIQRAILPMPDGVSRIQARLMDFVPGKPFSTDNYNSLKVHSICDSDGLGRLGITPRSMDAIMPRYLGDEIKSRRFGRMRAKAGRPVR